MLLLVAFLFIGEPEPLNVRRPDDLRTLRFGGAEHQSLAPASGPGCCTLDGTGGFTCVDGGLEPVRATSLAGCQAIATEFLGGAQHAQAFHLGQVCTGPGAGEGGGTCT